MINAGIYSTLTPEETKFILNDSGAKVLFVGNTFSLKKFKKIEAESPTVIKVIGIFDEMPVDAKFDQYKNVIVQGAQLLSKYADEIDKRFEAVSPEDISTFIYTSGTTGVPKGAMLTHNNFMTNCYDASDLVPDVNKDDRFLSFLPLCHVYERMATYYLGTYVGAQVAFAESIDKVAQNLGEIKPTIMACVPRLLEKIHDKVIKNASESGKIKKAIFFWAIGVGEKVRKCREAGKSPGPFLQWKFNIADKLVYSKLKVRMGGRMKLFVSGGGALAKHVGEFYGNLGLKVQEGYGLTETSPFVTVNEFDRQVFGTVGRVAPRQRVAIQEIETGKIITEQTYASFKPDFASEEGEILVKGPNIMKGYWNNKPETDKVFDADGWFHTGDIGKFESGYLKITDRLKNMLKSSLGKNLYPTQIENTYLKSPKIEQIFIIGDKREFVTAIIVPNPDELKPALTLNDDFLKEPDLFIHDEAVKAWLHSDIRKYGEALPKFERIRDFIIKRTAFTIEDGDMTITLKLKRKVVEAKYGAEIEKMYA
jgi:long-chain acyl-CoA synthetase